MNRVNCSRFFYLFLSFLLLISPLPLSAMIEKSTSTLEIETHKTIINSDDSYVYLGSELSNIAHIIDRVSAWDDNKDSLLHALKNHIDNGFFLAPYDAVMQALAYAETVIEHNINESNAESQYKLIADFELLANQLTEGSLLVDAKSLHLTNNEVNSYRLCEPRKRKDLVVDEKTTFTKNVRMKKKLHIDGKLKVDKSALFKDDVTIEDTLSAADAIIGNLSVSDLVIADCIEDLCVESLSVTDLAIANCMSSICVNSFSAVDGTISGTLTVNDAVVQDLTVITTVSVLDSIIQNLTVFGTLSATDAIIDDLTVTNCMNSLCVNSLSVVDMSISGTLSINDIIIDDATVTDFSATDAVIQSLSATDLIVVNCMDSLCVNSLSVVDMSISGTLSINDIIIDDATVTDFSAIDAVIQSLSATDLIVVNCMDSLCVNSLSVVDMSISGTLSVNDEIIQTFLRFNDASGGEFIGLRAPNIVPTSYTVSLPSTIPTANQVLRANATTPTNLEWITEGGSIVPAASKTIYVTKYGNDITGNGSFDTPYLTLSKAITIANGIASVLNPINILVSAGIYVENNSVGPLTIAASGISIVGDSALGVIIIPNTPTNDLLLITNTARISNLTLQSSAPLAKGVSFAAGNLSILTNIRVVNFLVGVSCGGGAPNSYGFNDCLFVNNGIALLDNNSFVECNNCTVFGVPSLVGPAANTGISVTGSSARLVFSGGICGVCDTAVTISNNATTTISSVGFRANAFDIVQVGPSAMVVSGCTFELTNNLSDIDVQISGSGATAEIIGCEFNGKDLAGTAEGTGIFVSDNAFVSITGTTLHDYEIGIQAGISTDTSSTSIFTSAVSIRSCVTDILQEGSAALNFSTGAANIQKIIINDSTNVTLAFFDLENENALTIGALADQNTTIAQAAITPTNNPEINYVSSLYSTQAIGLDNSLLSNPSSWFVLSNNEAYLTGITTDRAEVSGLRLVSDEGSPVGGTSELRGWNINKNGSAAELSFAYQNTDIVGQVAIPLYTVMQLDGFNNQLQLPTVGTNILFAGDTNLYRDSADVLKTDDNFIIGTLTPDRVVVTDAGTNQLASSTVTGTELGYLSGVTSSIQTQIDSKVAKAGDTMTGTLELPAGTTAAPSLVFTDSTTTGLSANGNMLSFSTAGLESMKIDSTGVVSINALTIPGVVHNNSLGNLSSSLIVDTDITNATISNAKLAAISSANTSGNIVVRDVSGNFATNMISLAGAVVNNTDAATKAYVDAAIALGIVAKTPARVVSLTDVDITTGGLLTIDGVALAANDRVLLVNQTNPVENGLWQAQVGSWTRPADFANGTQAGQAYVLIASGTINAGSSYLCNTPTAVIGTDPIGFSLFSLPDVTTGSNVGTGTGLVFRNKTGATLNFRSLLAGAHVTITNNADDITFITDATSANTPNTIVARDGSGNFSANTITANLLGAASLNVLKAGDAMTGALQLPAGTTLAPSLNFTGSPTTGLSASSDNLSFSTGTLERLKINPSGVVSINMFTTAGVVHNDASGNLSSSLIVNTDVDPAAAIVDTKLATISTAGKVNNSATTATSINTANAIVARDASGNFTAGTIIASIMGAASDNVLKAGDTMTGTLQLPAGTTALPSLVFTGSTTTGLSTSAGDLSFSTSGLERMKISSGGVISVDAFTTPGIVHNDASGNLSSSLIVNANVDSAAAIADTKLATISTAGKVANSATTAASVNTASAIVARDASGNFAANVVSVVDTVASGNLILSTEPSTSTAGNIFKGSNSFIHDFGTNNTFVGLNAGNFTTLGANNTAVGASALTANTTGTNNCAVGYKALMANTRGSSNIAIGLNALLRNTTGGNNVAINTSALVACTTGNNNIGIGYTSLSNLSTGSSNIGIGSSGGNSIQTGSFNTAIGVQAMVFSSGTSSSNTAIGANVFPNLVGSNNSNIGIGASAGSTLSSGSSNIYIGANAGAATENTTTRIGESQTRAFIAGIRGATTGNADAVAVLIDSTGQLGTISSSIRVKHDVEDMADASENLLDLRPVTFVYNDDATETKQYGLIAEEVDAVFPTIVVKDAEGKPETVQYHVLPILLLNEMKKQQATMESFQEKMNTAINSLQEQIEELITRVNEKNSTI
jgi:hypothetical protein